jgi:17beta-estradiol 17-dehydrogenase / very-long-chain 3-oxoacyl-CoA reductase
MTYERPCYFHEVASNPNFVTSIINLNVVAFTSVTRLLLPEMLQRGKGVFVNVGTVASVTGFPFFALYAATKSYMQQLTLDLALEYADKNIIFQYQNPGYVATKIAKIRNPSFFTPSPEQYAKAGLRSVGLQQSTCVWPPQRLAIGVLNIGLRIYGKDFVREGLHSLLYTFWLFAKKREIEKKKLVINTV